MKTKSPRGRLGRRRSLSNPHASNRCAKRSRISGRSMSMAPATILVVEDNADQAFVIARELRASGFEVATVYSAHEALDRLAQDTIDCVVLDYRLPDIHGIDGLADIRSDRPDLPEDLGFLAK